MPNLDEANTACAHSLCVFSWSDPVSGTALFKETEVAFDRLCLGE